jgi:hypothetical protein
MKSSFIPLFKRISMIIAVSLLFSCQTENAEIRRVVKQQLKAYPGSTLQDIYKSFFQDEFGPGHLLDDTAAARQYLYHELSSMSSRGNYTAEPCGTGKNFYRVPLDLVKDSKIPFEDYFSAFKESASTFRVPEINEWKGKWNQIVAEIETMNLPIKNFAEDKLKLSWMIDSGEFVVHHGETYGELYDPHYRIMGKEQWEGLKRATFGQ